MRILYIIPARGGSKGIYYKNIKLLNGKPLICYTIDVARQLSADSDICVTTDDDKIIEVVENYGLKVPFKRPENLATDTANTSDVIFHALEFYEEKNIFYDLIVLLQPSSPFRNSNHVFEALKLYNTDLDMIVSVKKSKSPTVLCIENDEGFVELFLNKTHLRRQDFESFYEYNGAIYIINVDRFKKLGLNGLVQIRKYLMDEISSLDIDTPYDWSIADVFIKTTIII